jgi:putative colanic acid biosynthesis glycosyltransferase
MKTLLQINSVINWGSTGKIVEDIGKQAILNGWESYVAFGRNDRASQSQLIKIGTNWETYLHVIYTRFFDMHGFASTRATSELVNKIQKISPDLILLHNLHGYYLNIQVLFKYLSSVNIPVVWTLHDCWPITGHCAYFDFCRCERWMEGCYECPQKNSYPASFFLDHSRINYSLKKTLFTSVEKMFLVPVSHWLSSVLSHSFLKHYPFKVIHNGIDLDTFVPQADSDYIRNKYLIGEKFMILGLASVWNERKGLRDFIELAAKLPKDNIILLVGLNSRQIKELPSQIIGISRTENMKELTALYSAADLYINPTWEDNFPTTNIEALACGTPVATYMTGGSIEAVTPETGFIVEKGDLNGLLNIIAEVKKKNKGYFATACRERAIKYFGKQERFQEYIELFNNMIQKY